MVEGKENCWERLASVVQWSNMSINHVAHHIGLRNGENLYQIKRGNHGISRKLAETIVVAFPQVSLLWLLTGEGDMFIPEATESLQTNFYDVDIEANIGVIERLDPRSTLMLPASIDVDFAMRYMGDAMGEMTPSNSVVMVKRLSLDQIIPGKEYIVEMSNVALLRIVRQSDVSSEMVRLVAIESDKYDDISIRRDAITALYRVVAKLIINY